MGRIRKNWLIRGLVFVGGVVSLRLVSYVLHMTTLDKVYKPRDFRKSSHLDISQETIDALPRYCQTIFGRKMDPINLAFVGTEAGLKRAFEKAGWDGAHPHSPVLILLGFLPGWTGHTYRKGPFSPLYINVGLQDLSFQKVLKKGYGNRHHIRIWRTRHQLPEGNRIWVAAATYEEGFRVGTRFPFVFHYKDPDLDWERDYIASELIGQGNLLAGEPELNTPILVDEPKHDPHRDTYYTDGKAKIIEIV
ncbi:MAG TPA: LssY C-terminal domain-containing protein [Candidatus Saccharimonadales bacterium]|nr:LssY C-terminal domain-containing protein [Candidatus Saccharimonadales bacterium]